MLYHYLSRDRQLLPAAPYCSIANTAVEDSPVKTTNLLDRTAIAMSGLCLAHCLMLPLLVLVLPLPAALANEHLHAQVLAIVLPVSMVAIAFGFRRHGDRRILIWGAMGMLLLILGGTLVHSSFGLVADTVVTIAGGLTLAATHYYNSLLARQPCNKSA
jgi:hypothetical protein